MARKFGDRVKETTDSTGTGTLELNGAPTGFRAFSAEFTSGDDTISYLVVDDPDNPSEYEYGKGTFTAGTPDTFARDTVEGSSNSGNKVSFVAGTKTVIATPTAADFLVVLGAGAWGAKSAKVRALAVDGAMLAADDGKLIEADGAAVSPVGITYTLLAAATAGDGFAVAVKNVGASGTVTIAAGGGSPSDKIDGADTYSLAAQYDSVVLRCDGSTWHAVARLAAEQSSAVVSKTSDYTVVASDDGKLIEANGSAISPPGLTVTLLAAATAGNGFRIVVKNVGASGTVTIAAGGGSPSDNIDGADTYSLSTQYDSVALRCDGSTWHVESDAVAEPGAAGKIAQVVNAQTGTVATGTTAIPDDDTIPQNTEGTEFMTLAITPSDASSTLLIDVVFVGEGSNTAGATPFCVALFQDSTAGALAAVQNHARNGMAQETSLRHKMTAGGTSATTFKVRAGAASGTTTFNGVGANRKLGGVLASSITITEILP